ncbi:MAG: hypothetical protein R6V11_06025 [Ectothiorhodospiraceae bacterium]
MTALTIFFAITAGLLLVSLIIVLTWSVSREQQHERQLQRVEMDHAQALRRQGELSSELKRTRDQQARTLQQARRQESVVREREMLIRQLGLDPARLERGQQSLHGPTALLRLRIGILLASTLPRRELADTATGRGEYARTVLGQLNERLSSGQNGYQQDEQARRVVYESLDSEALAQPPEPFAAEDALVD